MTKEQQQNITRHGEHLQAIFGLAGDPVDLCKKLHRLENKAHGLATDLCNGYVNQVDYDNATDRILARVDALLHFTEKHIQVFVNGDPRGYALKIGSDDARDMTIYRDMGGYGILAPTF